MLDIGKKCVSCDTIAAISTPLGTGGIGVIRISGPDAFAIGGRIFRGKTAFEEMKSHTVAHGRIIDPLNGYFLDDVLLIKMKGPNTFTAEDTVEISCHGGIVVLRNVLSLVLREGARAADPGEFTRRAFINGKMDLAQAEAVIDLINSKTDEGSRAAAAQLEGMLSQRIRGVRKELVGLIAHIEAVIDYPEYDIEELTGEKILGGIRSARDEILKIAGSYDRGRLIKEGISAAIIGKPNAGKSSLLNALAGVSRAIVTDIPGTTRDVIEEYINVSGIPVRFLDTAGIRDTRDPVESIGVEMARKAASEADLAIIVLDASTGILPEDIEILEFLNEKKKVIIINKTDISDENRIAAMKTQLEKDGNSPVIVASMLDGTGMDELLEAISGLFMEGAVDVNNEVLITSARHKMLLEDAAKCLESAEEAYSKGLPLDLAAIDIKESAENLGLITGESVSEDVVNEIFSRFCVGK
jgi:tRNA modification GTPase